MYIIKVTGDSLHKENFHEYRTVCISTKEEAILLRLRVTVCIKKIFQ